eukprot:1161734-Pelagomonas_calceolata.AAC.7
MLPFMAFVASAATSSTAFEGKDIHHVSPILRRRNNKPRESKMHKVGKSIYYTSSILYRWNNGQREGKMCNIGKKKAKQTEHLSHVILPLQAEP